jgi:Holliday junction resolvase RusA-like endonuclease
MNIIWNITPMGAPRTTRADAWKKRPVILRYHAFRDSIQKEMKKIDLGGSWSDLDTLTADFYIPMPDSWSKKKKLAMAGTPHQQKPDIDNVVKALLDSLFKDSDDCRVYSLHTRKFWSSEGRIEIII